MIELVASSLPGFKGLQFGPGLNVVLAQKSPGATERQTRNGVGKTSFVELVHFLLGAEVKSGHLLRTDDLVHEDYFLSLDLDRERVTVERSPSNPDAVFVNGARLDNGEWRAVLGASMFGLPAAEAQASGGYAHSFRSLFSYFARRQNSGGFQSPQQHSTKQQPYDVQVSLSYLFGLDAEIPRQLQLLRNREQALRALRKAARGPALGAIIGKASELRTQLAVQETRTARLREQLAAFQVVPQYRDYEREATELTTELSALANDDQIDLARIAQLEESLRAEAPPRFADVAKAYEEAGLVLPGLVRKRFEDVQEFHRSVITNRRSHLDAELADCRRRIEARALRQRTIDERRAQLMNILQSGGALEHFAQLQAELGRQEARAEDLRKRFDAAETLERNRSQLEVARARLHQQLQDDHHERAETIAEAITVFEDLSNELYEKAGSLTVSDSPNGPQFEVKIEAARSKGINNMQIFCFDMTLMELSLRRGRGPGFLIHDSHLFDGVDERQVARALQIGAQRAERLGFQYIVMMNEDAVPRAELDPSFRFDEYVNPVRLTDESETGGLFGRRFA